MTVGCSSDDESDDGGSTVDYTDRVHSLDLSGIQGLYITGDNLDSDKASALRSSSYSGREIQRAASQVDLDPNSLYKVTENGTLERVKITDDTGEELPRGVVRPMGVKDINAQYLMIWIQVRESEYIEDAMLPSGFTQWSGEAFLVHKSTGLAYDASELVGPLLITSLEGGMSSSPALDIQWDENNNLYIRTDFPSSQQDGKNFVTAVYKIDTSNLGDKAITATEIKSAYGIGEDWIVDKEGKFIAFGRRELYTEPTRYLAIDTGSVYNLNDSIPELFQAAWIRGMDNEVYSFVDDTTCSDCYKLYSVGANADGSPKVVKIADTNTTVGAPWLLKRKNRYIIGGRLFYIGSWNEGSAFAIEDVDVVNATVYGTSLSDIFLTVEEFVVSNSKVYCFGKFKDNLANGLYAYDPISRTGTKIVVDVAYDVQKFKLMANGEFLVEGIRLNDQAYFYGRLSSGGVVTVTSTVAIGAPEVIVMEAIRPTDFMTIDGRVSEWSTSLRKLTDLSSDGAADGELLYYSDSSSNAQYFGMVEYQAGLNKNYFVEVAFVGGEKLLLGENSATFNGTDLGQVNGAAARVDVIEFLLPLSTLSTPSVTSVTLFGQDANGDVNTSNLIDQMK